MYSKDTKELQLWWSIWMLRKKFYGASLVGIVVYKYIGDCPYSCLFNNNS